MLDSYRADTSFVREVGERIRQERKAAGLTLEEAGQAVGVSDDCFSQFEHGRRPAPLRVLEKVAAWRGSSLEWLLFGEEPSSVAETATEEARHYTTRRPIRVPVIARAAADPAARITWDPIDPPGERELPAGTVAIEVHGDSMRPIALPGQAVIAVEESAGNGDLAAVECCDGRRFFKRLWWLKGHERVILESIQHGAIEPPVMLKVSEIQRMWRIVGVLF